MVFEKKIVNLKNGHTCILRSIEVKDAEAMIDFLRIVSSQTPFLLRNEDEVTYTVASEKRILENKRNDPREIMMAAEIDGMIVGNCGIMSNGNLRRVHHRCRFAIALVEAYWNLGIGSAMMDYGIFFSKKNGIRTNRIRSSRRKCSGKEFVQTIWLHRNREKSSCS